MEVARVFVAEWDHVLEGTYGRTMQQNWMLYRADPGRFTVAWQDKVMEQGAAKLTGLVQDLHATLPSAAAVAAAPPSSAARA